MSLRASDPESLLVFWTRRGETQVLSYFHEVFLLTRWEYCIITINVIVFLAELFLSGLVFFRVRDGVSLRDHGITFCFLWLTWKSFRAILITLINCTAIIVTSCSRHSIVLNWLLQCWLFQRSGVCLFLWWKGFHWDSTVACEMFWLLTAIIIPFASDTLWYLLGPSLKSISIKGCIDFHWLRTVIGLVVILSAFVRLVCLQWYVVLLALFHRSFVHAVVNNDWLFNHLD